MDKKILIIGMIFILSPFVLAQNITDSQIPLGKNIIINGTTTTSQPQTKCSFYIYDLNGNLVKRLTDEYTTDSNTFTSDYYQLEEPIVLRGFDYNAVTKCGNETFWSVFTVENKEALLAHQLNQETDFLTKEGNLNSVYIAGTIIGFFLVSILIVYWTWKKAKG